MYPSPKSVISYGGIRKTISYLLTHIHKKSVTKTKLTGVLSILKEMKVPQIINLYS